MNMPIAPSTVMHATQPIKAGWVIIGAGIAAVVGSFLPWATVTAAFVGTISVTGTDQRGGDGWLVVALGLAAVAVGIFLVRGRRLAKTTSAVTVALFGLASFEILYIATKLGDSSFDSAFIANASIGIGLWLVLAAGIAAAVGMVLVWESPQPTS